MKLGEWELIDEWKNYNGLDQIKRKKYYLLITEEAIHWRNSQIY